MRTLQEQLKSIGLTEGIDLGMAGIKPLDEGESTDTITDPDDLSEAEKEAIGEAANTIAETTYNKILEDYSEYIDYDEEEFQEDLFQSIVNLLSEEVVKGTELDEAQRMIMKLVGGRLKRTVQKLRSVGERRKARMKARRKKATRRIPSRKYRRSAKGRRYAKRRAKAERKMGESAVAGELRNLLTESTKAKVSGDDLAMLVVEATERTDNVFRLLADFFEEFGTEEDVDIAGVLDEGIEAIDSYHKTLLEGEVDVADAIERLKKFSKMTASALKEYNKYDMVVEDDDEEDDPDTDPTDD